MQFVILIGRILFSLVFFATLPGNFDKEKAKGVSANGLPVAGLIVPLSSLIAFAGALSVLLSIYAEYGAWLLIIFLVPVTFIQHKFWAIEDPLKRRGQYINFLKNFGLIGGALIIAANGSGTLSADRLF